MQNMYKDQKPDPLEKKVRFGCGFLLGLILGFFEVARTMYRYNSAALLILVTVTFAFVCGGLAVKYGDSFWEQLGRLRRW
jgi:hypothetical protein